MKKEGTSLIQLLKSLSRKELRKLDKFLRSPYFTEGKNISSGIIYRYFEILRKYHPHFEDQELSDEKIYSRLYPDGTSSVNIIRKLNSDLLHLAEKFLSQQEFERNENELRQNLLLQLSGRKVEKVFNRRFNEMLKYLETLDKDEEYFYEIYNTWNNYWTNYFLSKSVYKLEESVKHRNNFFIYVVLASLRIYLVESSLLSGFTKMQEEKSEFYLYNEILNHVKENYSNYEEVPQILIHYNLIKMIKSKEESYYYNLKVLKSSYFDILTNADKYNLFIMMTNFCQYMIFHNDFKFRRERFLLDKEFLQTHLIDWLGGIHFFQFLSITKNAIKLREFKWVEKTIEELSQKIESKYRDFAVNFVKALIYFERKSYNKALELLAKLTIEYSHEKQYIRNLMLQIYYETGEDETALSLIDTGRHFIHRDKHLNEEAKKNSLNFIRFTEKLIKARVKLQPDLFFTLKKEISANSSVENKDWLLEKIEEILKAENPK